MEVNGHVGLRYS